MPASAQSFSPTQRSEIETIVHDYLVKHPEVLQEVIAEMEKRQSASDAQKHKDDVVKNSEAIFNSKHQVTLGNPQGDVTMVEFFDYNCPYCKHAMNDMLELMKSDPKLRVVLKEFPVLGPASVEAAQVATAARMQDSSGKKYLVFHEKLLSDRGHADKARALAVAKESGFDMVRLEKDMQSDEVKTSLQESFRIAELLGLNGTPSYVIGTDVVVGAVGVDAIKEKINNARCGKTQC